MVGCISLCICIILEQRHIGAVARIGPPSAVLIWFAPVPDVWLGADVLDWLVAAGVDWFVPVLSAWVVDAVVVLVA
jgi:hypothetical protein